jgi:hypothetical protein
MIAKKTRFGELVGLGVILRAVNERSMNELWDECLSYLVCLIICQREHAA